jgi:hypothetical protein
VFQHALDHPIDIRRFEVLIGYGVTMTAAAAYPVPEPKRLPFADASPDEVRAALIPEEVVEFDRQWRFAMAEATEKRDLSRVYETLELWRRHAVTTQALGAEDYRRMLAQAEHTLRTGEPPAGTVSQEEIMELIRKRLGG